MLYSTPQYDQITAQPSLSHLMQVDTFGDTLQMAPYCITGNEITAPTKILKH